MASHMFHIYCGIPHNCDKKHVQFSYFQLAELQRCFFPLLPNNQANIVNMENVVTLEVTFIPCTQNWFPNSRPISMANGTDGYLYTM